MGISVRLTCHNVKSGLIDLKRKLKNIHQIDFVHFSAKDVVRHPVVAQIILELI